MRLVLAEYADPPHAGVQAVRQRKIDDSELAAKKHPGGLGGAGGNLLAPAAAPAGQHQRNGPAGQSLLDASTRQHRLVLSSAPRFDAERRCACRTRAST